MQTHELRAAQAALECIDDSMQTMLQVTPIIRELGLSETDNANLSKMHERGIEARNSIGALLGDAAETLRLLILRYVMASIEKAKEVEDAERQARLTVSLAYHALTGATYDAERTQSPDAAMHAERAHNAALQAMKALHAADGEQVHAQALRALNAAKAAHIAATAKENTR